jgi:hypothetical protein
MSFRLAPLADVHRSPVEEMYAPIPRAENDLVSGTRGQQ